MSGRTIDNGRICLALLLLGSGAGSHAEMLDISVVDKDGMPVADVAVFVLHRNSAQSSLTSARAAVMDQRDTQFVPHVLVVQKGTTVEFPNSDTVAHHVYSFSRPNNFVLQLYKGDPHEPVTFEHEGVVTLGCNIHDHMLAYILVVDSDTFGTTDASGRVYLPVDDAVTEYSVQIWSPRIRDSEQELKQLVSVKSPATTEITFALQKKLRNPHGEQSGSVAWSEY